MRPRYGLLRGREFIMKDLYTFDTSDEEALRILKKVRDTFNLPVLTDIHESEDAAIAAKVVDVLQIPAFLCRQTELLLAAAATGN